MQSAALCLISERDAEIEVFKPQEYWTVEAVLESPSGSTFRASLAEVGGRSHSNDEASCLECSRPPASYNMLDSGQAAVGFCDAEKSELEEIGFRPC